jgi:hypothetical protein
MCGGRRRTPPASSAPPRRAEGDHGETLSSFAAIAADDDPEVGVAHRAPSPGATV